MTYREIFEQAREAGHKWADAALENCYQFGKAEKECRPTSLPSVLKSAFVWDDTNQGYDFWLDIWRFLPKSP